MLQKKKGFLDPLGFMSQGHLRLTKTSRGNSFIEDVSLGPAVVRTAAWPGTFGRSSRAKGVAGAGQGPC